VSSFRLEPHGECTWWGECPISGGAGERQTARLADLLCSAKGACRRPLLSAAGCVGTSKVGSCFSVFCLASLVAGVIAGPLPTMSPRIYRSTGGANLGGRSACYRSGRGRRSATAGVRLGGWRWSGRYGGQATFR
jgi:hypothetical protein